MINRLLGSAAGLLCGLAVPFTGLLWRAFFAKKDWWIHWLKTEFHQHGIAYTLTAVWSTLILGFIGYFLGQHYDHTANSAQSARDSNLELNELAATDGLTKLFNTRAINERLEHEMEAAHDRLAPLSCLLVDVDHFKRINDTFGHPYGDVVLVGVAKHLRKLVRRVDAVGRLGGEEFFIVMPNTTHEAAMETAQRIRKAIEAMEFNTENKKVPITVSIGVVRYPAAGLSDKESLFKAVDQALYSAKKAGRNRVISA